MPEPQPSAPEGGDVKFLDRTQMKRCNYCGRENEAAYIYCTGCGTFFPEEPPAPIKPPPIPETEPSIREPSANGNDVAPACGPEPRTDPAPPLPESRTRRCDYCGRENQVASACCSGCGTPFPVQEPTAPDQQPPTLLPCLNARSATLVFGVFLGVSCASAFVLSCIYVILQLARGLDLDSIVTFAGPETIYVDRVILPIAFLLGGLASVIAARRLAGDDLWDARPEGAAWIVGSQKQLAQGAALGCLVAVISLGTKVLGAVYWGPYNRHYLFDMLVEPGLSRILWVLALVVIAPVVEELLFRGVLYGGYRRSFGAEKAALLTTGLFCLMHVPQLLQNPRGLVPIAGLALMALFLRVRFGAVGPAVAAHYAYNGTLVVFVVLSLRVLMK